MKSMKAMKTMKTMKTKKKITKCCGPMKAMKAQFGKKQKDAPDDHRDSSHVIDNFLEDMANEKIQVVRKRLTRMKIGRQMYNIRASLSLSSNCWNSEAQGLLRTWALSKKRKKDKRSSPPSVASASKACTTSGVVTASGSTTTTTLTLDSWLRTRHISCVGLIGHIKSSGRIGLFKEILSLRSVSETCLVIQTGFNAGHSADIILGFLPACKLISFQLLAAQQTMTRKMTLEGAKFVATKYPERHSLIYWDS